MRLYNLSGPHPCESFHQINTGLDMHPSAIPLTLLSACKVIPQSASIWSCEAAVCVTWLLSTVILHVREWHAFHLVVKLSGEKLCFTSPPQATRSNHCNMVVIYIYISESLYQICESSSTLTWTGRPILSTEYLDKKSNPEWETNSCVSGKEES